MVALVCYAFSANLAVPLQQKYGGPALMLRVEIVGAVLTAPLAVWGLGDSEFKWTSLLAVLVLGIVGTGAAFAVMAVVLGRVGATRGSIVTYLMPPVSIMLGVVFRDEHIAVTSLVGMAVVLAGRGARQPRSTVARPHSFDSGERPTIPATSR